MLRDASEEVPVSVSRGIRICGFENYLTRRSGTLRPLAGASASAAADLPGLRPFRRGSWILAQTCPTQRRPEAKRLKRWTQSSRTQRRPEETHLHSHRIFKISLRIWLVCRRIHVFTMKIAYCTFFIGKVWRKWAACRRAVRRQTLQTRNSYNFQLKFNIFTFLTARTRVYFAF